MRPDACPYVGTAGPTSATVDKVDRVARSLGLAGIDQI